jgi:diacylglycerol kinase
MNSAIEKFIDLLHPEQHAEIKWVKDVAAGAVLVSSVISAVIGIIIFSPKLFIFLHK